MFNAFVVCAESEEQARLTHPRSTIDGVYWDESAQRWRNPPEPHVSTYTADWCDDLASLDVQLIGYAVEGLPPGVIHTSYLDRYGDDDDDD